MTGRGARFLPPQERRRLFSQECPRALSGRVRKCKWGGADSLWRASWVRRRSPRDVSAPLNMTGRGARFLPPQERRGAIFTRMPQGLVRPRKEMQMGRRGLSLASVLGTPTFPERCFGSAQHDRQGGEVPASAGTTGRYFRKNDEVVRQAHHERAPTHREDAAR